MPKVPGTHDWEGRQSGALPICKDCGHSDNVVRWLGQWICRKHLKVNVRSQSLERQLSQIEMPTRVRDKLVAENTITFQDVFPNRAARRAAGRHKSRV